MPTTTTRTRRPAPKKTVGAKSTSRSTAVRKRPVKTVELPVRDVVWARQQVEDLKQALVITVEKIVTIMESEAWKLMGYETFDKMWINEGLSDITLPKEVRPYVVYRMYDDGATPEHVAAAVKEIAENTAENFQREKANNVPPGAATGRGPRGGTKSLVETVFLHIPTPQLARWHQIIKRNNMTMKEFEDLAIHVINETVEAL